MDWKNKTTAELSRLLIEEKEKVRSFRFGMAGSKTKNVKEGKALRKDIARILTELQKRRTGK